MVFYLFTNNFQEIKFSQKRVLRIIIILVAQLKLIVTELK